jgi:predicted metal-binding membrane protein
VQSATFLGGYLCCWVIVGIGAYWLLALARVAGVGSLRSAEVARYGVAPIALLAALYELTPLKRACLRHCRGPLAFFMSNWRDGVGGAFKMGAAHGVYCVGCCWMLMLVLLALGVMSVTWMAGISIAIAVEKLVPATLSRRADRLLIGGLVALGVIAIIRPAWLPGFGAAGSSSEPMM